VYSLQNKVFGDLEVIGLLGEKINGKIKWKCKCVCGKEAFVLTTRLIRGHTRSCGCLRGRATAEINRRKAALDNTYCLNKLYSNYRRDGLRRGLPFDLSYCNTIPKQVYKHPTAEYIDPLLYNGVDRKNNLEGYVVENCVSCCGTCNKAKMTSSYEDFLDWIRKVYRHTNEC
jgi:hypothetical protein